MAKIQIVDYAAIPSQAQTMRSCGNSLNSELINAYQSISNMHSSWYGKRYNELVKSFNNMIPDLNEMLELVVKEIPSTLEIIANNYSQADTGMNVAQVNTESAKKIQEVPASNDTGMKFITSNVESVQTRVKTNFTKAIDQMNRIEATFKQITWTSEAAESFKARFTSLKGSIVNNFDTIITEFTTLMDKTKEDIEKAENANKVG